MQGIVIKLDPHNLEKNLNVMGGMCGFIIRYFIHPSKNQTLVKYWISKSQDLPLFWNWGCSSWETKPSKVKTNHQVHPSAVWKAISLCKMIYFWINLSLSKHLVVIVNEKRVEALHNSWCSSCLPDLLTLLNYSANLMKPSHLHCTIN